MRTILILIVLIIACSSLVLSQISVYAASSCGYNQNPLYNYQKLSDQLRQLYVEVTMAKETEMSQARLQYSGGLMLFNRFRERNYYEHQVTARYAFELGVQSDTAVEIEPQEITTEEDDTVNVPEETEPAERDSTITEKADTLLMIEKQEDNTSSVNAEIDSTGDYLDFSVNGGARHDRSPLRDFDNYGGSFNASIRSLLSDHIHYRIGNTATIRNYPQVRSLSNVTNTVSLQIGSNSTGAVWGGVVFSYGIKWYTSTSYDTSLYETVRTYVEKPSGKGKFGKILVPSSKKVLLDAQSTSTSQLTALLFTGGDWEKTHVVVSALYRYNPKNSARRLAQDSTASILTDDLYNDYYSYSGGYVQLSVSRTLMYDVNLAAAVELSQRRFGIKALTLLGEELSKKRRDLNTDMNVTLSKGIGVAESVSCDVSLIVEYMRSQSNDEYNDFSGTSISLSIGIGF